MKEKKDLITFCLSGEALENCGEDSYLMDRDNARVIAAVFDGCGGIGAMRYPNYRNHTGAYMSSRAVCGAVSAWFSAEETDADQLREKIGRALSVCKKYSGVQSALRGSLGKTFPTTMAAAVCNYDANSLKTQCLWAGDSRCYLLDSDGLHQLTKDDTGGDALSNLTSDGVLTNVINGSVPFELHSRAYVFRQPCIVFSSTDGCFGYIASPMEFEVLLLKTMVESNSVPKWKDRLRELFQDVSGDDYTMCLVGCGFRSFSDLKQYYHARYCALQKMLGSNLERGDIWLQYRDKYELYR